MQRVIQISCDVGVRDTDIPSSVYNNLQAAQSSTEGTDCEPVLMEEDTLTEDEGEYEDQNESRNEDQDWEVYEDLDESKNEVQDEAEYEDQMDNDETVREIEDEQCFEKKVNCMCFV